MSNHMLVQAWKDEEYRLSLSEAECALLPENPAGSLELTDAELELVAGGGLRGRKICDFTFFFCGLSILCGGTIIL